MRSERGINSNAAKVVSYYLEYMSSFLSAYRGFIAHAPNNKLIKTIIFDHAVGIAYTLSNVSFTEQALRSTLTTTCQLRDEVCIVGHPEEIDANTIYFEISANKAPIHRQLTQDKQVVKVIKRDTTSTVCSKLSDSCSPQGYFGLWHKSSLKSCMALWKR